MQPQAPALDRRIRATLAKSPLPGRMHTDHLLRKPAASDSCYAPRVAGGTFAGMAAKVQEQNLAVFGESGSGETVLLSLSPLIVGLLFRPGP
jgi:hypothetical protein